MSTPETRKPGGNRAAPARPSAQALQVLEGERLAAEFLEALRDGRAGGDELAVLLARLYGPRLRGACGLLAKLLEEAARRLQAMGVKA